MDVLEKGIVVRSPEEGLICFLHYVSKSFGFTPSGEGLNEAGLPDWASKQAEDPYVLTYKDGHGELHKITIMCTDGRMLVCGEVRTMPQPAFFGLTTANYAVVQDDWQRCFFSGEFDKVLTGLDLLQKSFETTFLVKLRDSVNNIKGLPPKKERESAVVAENTSKAVTQPQPSKSPVRHDKPSCDSEASVETDWRTIGLIGAGVGVAFIMARYWMLRKVR
eukprot:Rmarinus@m.23260